MDEDTDGAAQRPWTPGLVALCLLKHVPTKHGARVRVGDEDIALFRSGDRVWAVEDKNPYTACGVAGGRLSLVGHTPVVVSPLYHLVFDLRTGACLNAIDLPQQRLRTFAVELIGDVVHVDPASTPRRVPLAGLSLGA